MQGEKLVTSITLNDPHGMGDKGRKEVAKWLREKAKEIVREGENYSTRFKAAYYWTK